MNKPLKRHRFIIEYSKDHHYGLLLVWKIRQGLKKNIESHRIAGYINLFAEKELLPHFDEEEKFLLNLLSPNDALKIEAEKQHLELRQFLFEIMHEKVYYTTLNNFADFLEKHIRFEEREFFPHLQKTIDLDTVFYSEKKPFHNQNEFDTLWTDNFWESNSKVISYETVSEAINDLINRGYTTDFSIISTDECLICNNTSVCLPPSEFKIDEMHRFEGATDPGDEMVVYAISSEIHKTKGFIVNAFGIYENPKTSKIIELLQKK